MMFRRAMMPQADMPISNRFRFADDKSRLDRMMRQQPPSINIDVDVSRTQA